MGHFVYYIYPISPYGGSASLLYQPLERFNSYKFSNSGKEKSNNKFTFGSILKVRRYLMTVLKKLLIILVSILFIFTIL